MNRVIGWLSEGIEDGSMDEGGDPNETEGDHILKEIEKAGLPLEIKTSNILELNKWLIVNQEGYLDSDTQIWRTIDIRADKGEHYINDSLTYNYFNLSLIIECKKSDKPWVFFMKEKRHIPDVLLIKMVSLPVLNHKEIAKWRDFHHYYSSCVKQKAIISYEPFVRGGHAVFEAANQVVKALDYHLKIIREVDAKAIGEAKAKGEPCYQPIVVCYPVIVYDGHMFELTYPEGRAKLVPSQYVQYAFSQKVSTFYHEFIIDIVHIDFLEQYLKIIDKEYASLDKRIKSLRSTG